MPTFREDLHLGHKVPTVETDDIANHSITEEKLADNSVSTRTIQDGAVTNPKIADEAVDGRTIADEAVDTKHIKDKAVTPEKLSDRIVPEVIEPILKPLRDKDKDLQNQIDSLTIHGMAVSTEFGDDNLIGISQKALTEAFNRVWSKLEEITGESLKGFNLIVTPEYYIGEEGCTVHISASSADTVGRFEYIKFYINNILAIEEYDVESLEYTTTVNETSEIKCVAKILGIEYTETKMLTHYSSFFLGASTSYTNIMNVGHVISINDHMRGNYNVPFNDGDHLYVVVGKSLRDGFARADMNGVEIPFTETEVTVGGVEYVVFTSVNTYQQGTYNIDINS